MYSTNNYSIKKELVFFPLNKLDQASISLNNNRLTSIKKKCGYCDSETCYDCSQCDAGISETYITVPNILFKKLPLIEKQILDNLELLNLKDDKSFKNKEDAIKYIQKTLRNKKFSNCEFARLIQLNQKMGNFNEISYYISKSLNFFDSKLIFLLKLYEYIVFLAKGELRPYNLFYYKYYKKYEYLIKDFGLNLLVTKKEFDDLYQDVPDNVGSLLNYYSPKKEYTRASLTNKNYECDINFEVASKCRQEDTNIYFINKASRKIRDQIRSEFGLKKPPKQTQAKLPKIELELKLINCDERR